jgi:hypothetical protein
LHQDAGKGVTPSKISALGSMKKSIHPDDTRDTRPAATPLADSWQASVPKGATPGIFRFMGPDCFGVGHGTQGNFTTGVRVFRYDKPHEQGGKSLFWALEVVDYDGDKETVEKIIKSRGRPTVKRILKQEWFETEEQAKARFPEFVALAKVEMNKVLAALGAAQAHKPSEAEKDLVNARLKVMREQYPDTFKAMDALAEALPEARPAALEALFRAYAVDLVRLHKPENLGDISPFKSPPDDMAFFLEITNAYKAKSPRDPVDVEIAARWYAAGYDKMKPDEYTAAINAKTGANLKPDAMKKRRLKKLRLLSSNPEGAPIREI